MTWNSLMNLLSPATWEVKIIPLVYRWRRDHTKRSKVAALRSHSQEAAG